MANDLNQCNFIGRMGKDPEVRFMPNGDAVASFSIAVGSSWKDKQSGEKKESTEWVNVTSFGKVAEIIWQYTRKGSKVFINGRMKTDKYTDKEGIERHATKIILENIQFLDKKTEFSGENNQAQNNGSAQNKTANVSANFYDMDDMVPF